MRKFIGTLAVLAIALMSLMSFGGNASAASIQASVATRAQTVASAAVAQFGPSSAVAVNKNVNVVNIGSNNLGGG